MAHMRYWAMSLATAVCGGFIAVERFAFAPHAAVWIAFGIAIGATACSLSAFAVALSRGNHDFSTMSAICALAGGWTIMAVPIFAAPTALWLVFAGGVALLAVSLQALALHERTIERVVHGLERAAPEAASAAGPASVRRLVEVSAPMRSWTYWLTHTGIAVAGAFVVLMTFALSGLPAPHASVRWLAFAVAIASLVMAAGALAQRIVLREGVAGIEGTANGRRGALLLTAASAAVSIAMIVTMTVYAGSTARWLAFAFGCGLVGVSLLAHVGHELTTDRVRHEVEIAEPAPVQGPLPVDHLVI
jgi:hypothetical protein